MGQHTRIVTGIGKDRSQAEATAIASFLAENGTRHEVRGVESAILISKVPPRKEIEAPPRKDRYGRPGMKRFVTVQDPLAPANEWLKEWEFTLHTHT